MKKFAVIVSALTAVLTAGAIVVPVLAASNPADDISTYSYNTGSQSAQARNNTFAEMPSGDDAAKGDVEAWFEENGIGEEAAWTDGQYDESAKTSYGYVKGQAAYQERHASFSEEN